MLLYALTIALSAFLLFEVQPIIAKMILPWFGGSSAVWSTCVLFFQLVLLLGYGYAHWLHRLAACRLAATVGLPYFRVIKTHSSNRPICSLGAGFGWRRFRGLPITP